jgi:hypothetical protein
MSHGSQGHTISYHDDHYHIPNDPDRKSVV